MKKDIQKCSKQKNFKPGFTLLELLVVVLIIGILAGVALPQYRKATVKAQTRQLISHLKAVSDAQQRFYLANNRYATNFNDLDIEIAGYTGKDCSDFSSWGPTDCLSNNHSVLFFNNSGAIHVLFNKGKYVLSGFTILLSRDSKNIYCYHAGRNNNKLCTDILNCTFDFSLYDYNYYYKCNNL